MLLVSYMYVTSRVEALDQWPSLSRGRRATNIFLGLENAYPRVVLSRVITCIAGSMSDERMQRAACKHWTNGLSLSRVGDSTNVVFQMKIRWKSPRSDSGWRRDIC